MDPFTEVKSAKHMVKSKTNPSQVGVHFPIFPKLNVQSIIFCAWEQKESAKLQNTPACTDKTGLSSMKLVREMIGRSKEFEDVGRVASSFPTCLGKIEATLLAG